MMPAPLWTQDPSPSWERHTLCGWSRLPRIQRAPIIFDPSRVELESSISPPSSRTQGQLLGALRGLSTMGQPGSVRIASGSPLRSQALRSRSETGDLASIVFPLVSA